MEKMPKKYTPWWVIPLIVLVSIMIPLIYAYEMDNPYTKAGYPGWHDTKIPGMTVKLPENWQLTVGEMTVPGRYEVTLTDTAGTQLAQGFLFSYGMEKGDLDEAVEAIAGMPISEYRTLDEFETILMGRGGAFGRGIFFSNKVKVLDTWRLFLSTGPARLYLWFPYCEGAEYEALADYARGVIRAFPR